MRFLQVAAGVLLVGQALAQKPQAEAPRLQAIIQAQRDSVGANIVKVSVLDPTYAVSTLKKQIDELGKLAGSGSRGIQINEAPIDPKDPSSRLLRVTFAVDGIIDRKGGWVKIAPIVKAFAGTSKEPGFGDFQIDFDYERPNALDLDSFSSGDIDVQRRQVDKSMEYTVLVKHREAGEVEIPDFAAATPTPPNQVPQTKTDWFAVLVGGVAIAAVGALVYCLFLLKPSQRRPRR